MSRLGTMWSRLAPRERRTVVVALALLGGAWLGLRGIPQAVRAAGAARLKADVATAILARAREALVTEPIVRESLAVRAARLVGAAPRLFGGASGAEAAADLASYASGAAEQRRVRIVRQDARADSTVSVFIRLVLRLEAEGDIAGVTGWLADLEEGQKLVAVRSLSIQAPEPASAGGQAERLRVELVVEAWAVHRNRGAD